MSKPVEIIIHISGFNRARIDDEDRFNRPPTAAEIARVVTDELNHKFIQAGLGTIRATVASVKLP